MLQLVCMLQLCLTQKSICLQGALFLLRCVMQTCRNIEHSGMSRVVDVQAIIW